MGMVGRAEVDMAVASVTLAEDRFHLVNFSYPYLSSDITFITDKLQPLSTDLALLYPFSVDFNNGNHFHRITYLIHFNKQ